MNERERALQWLNSDIDAESKTIIKALLEEDKSDELTDAFYKELEFGTGGLRGVMGVGSNRINKFTVGKATQGLSNYLKKCYPDQDIKVVVGYDSRNNSRFYAKTTAAVFSANDIYVYLFEDLRPTPQLSYAIRKYKCQSGVVITASHNPKEYNGYKAYWSDGAQLIHPRDQEVINEVNSITDLGSINFFPVEEKIEILESKIDDEFIDVIAQTVHFSETALPDFPIVYSPIHGTGITLIPKMLKKVGFEQVHVVESQATPDGNFPTVIHPNPEEKQAMLLAIEEAKKVGAELVMGTDPDADRVGIAVKNGKGDFELLNGNETGCLIVEYLLQQWEKAGKITGNEFVVKTIVTSDLISKIAINYHVKCYDTLTGFKYIAELIKELESKEIFICGGEESYGYMVGDFVRDKDAVSACAVIALLVAEAKFQSKSAFDILIDIYLRHGFYREKLISLTKEGKKGAEKILEMMRGFRENPPKIIAGSPVNFLIDYQSSVKTDLSLGETSLLTLPKSNVLQFITEDNSKISIRPSGTEPKVKFYISVNQPLNDKSDYALVKHQLDDKIEAIIEDLNLT